MTSSESSFHESSADLPQSCQQRLTILFNGMEKLKLSLADDIAKQSVAKSEPSHPMPRRLIWRKHQNLAQQNNTDGTEQVRNRHELAEKVVHEANKEADFNIGTMDCEITLTSMGERVRLRCPVPNCPLAKRVKLGEVSVSPTDQDTAAKTHALNAMSLVELKID